MTDETQAAMPVEDAPVPADSSPAEPAEPVETKPDETGKPSEENLSEKVQKRFDQLTWEREQARREADYYRSMAMQPKPEPEPEKVVPLLPKLEDFGYDEAKYQAALIDYATKQARDVVESRLSEAAHQARELRRVEAFTERQRNFAKSAPDFEAKVLQDPTLPITEGMRDVILDSDAGPEIAYYLANNRQVAQQIASLPPHLAALEMGRIEGRMSAKKEATAPKVSSAPPPPPKVESSDAAVDRDPDKMTDAEWMKWREKQISAARARQFIKR